MLVMDGGEVVVEIIPQWRKKKGGGGFKREKRRVEKRKKRKKSKEMGVYGRLMGILVVNTSTFGKGEEWGR